MRLDKVSYLCTMMLFRIIPSLFVDKASCTRQFESKLSLHLFALSLQQIRIKTKNMSSSTLRVPTSFRLPSELLEELKERAKATNCSLNNYVESILTDVMRKDKTMEENVITPDLQDKIDKVREEIHCGQYTTLKSHDDIDNYLASL